MSQRNDNRWMEMYELTKRYIDVHLLPPSTHNEFEGEKVGTWLRNQEQFRCNGTLAANRKEYIEKLQVYHPFLYLRF